MSHLPLPQVKPATRKGQRVYGKLPTSPPFRAQIPSLDFLDAFGFKTNVKNIREGDWICLYCQNLNFSFRNECNRCQAFAEPPAVRDPHEIIHAALRENGFVEYRTFGSLQMINSSNASFGNNNERRNELFDKVLNRDDFGFSNVVFISFELQDTSEDSADEGEDLKQFETTRILSLLDE